jgi:alpha-beta hydrolase superfamily lysophospholipase
MTRALDFQFTDRGQLSTRLWEAEAEASRGVVGIVHGLGEHSGRYEHVAAALTRVGYTVLAFDLPGHGRSPGRRGHASFAGLLSDVRRLADEVVVRAGDAPAILYGHSLGGALVLTHAIRRQPEGASPRFVSPQRDVSNQHQRKLTALVASSPLLRLSSPPSLGRRAAACLLRFLCPWFLFDTRLDPNVLSHDADVVRDHQQDPLVHHCVSASLGDSMLRTGDWLLRHADRLPVPTLLMHGGADALTSPAASREFAERAGPRCTLKIWEGLRHELQWEPEKDRVFRFTIDWLEMLRTGKPSGPLV